MIFRSLSLPLRLSLCPRLARSRSRPRIPTIPSALPPFSIYFPLFLAGGLAPRREGWDPEGPDFPLSLGGGYVLGDITFGLSVGSPCLAEQLALLFPVFSGSVCTASPGFLVAREAVSSRRLSHRRGTPLAPAGRHAFSCAPVLRKFGPWAVGSEPLSLLPRVLIQSGFLTPGTTPLPWLERRERRQCRRGRGPGSARPGRGLAEAGRGPGRGGRETRRRAAAAGAAQGCCLRAGGRTGAPVHGRQVR